MVFFTRIFVFLAIACATVIAKPNVCKMGNIVNRPFTSTYSFPTSWNETHSAPHLAADQSCSWAITVPQGYYAKLIISGKINDTIGHFQLVDINGNVVMSQHENKEPYYYPSPKFTLIVNNEAPATFAFKVIWAQYPQTQSVIAGINEVPHLVNITQDVFASAFGCDTGISLLAFPEDEKNFYTLRSVLVFAGIDEKTPFINNLAELHKNPDQFISSSTGVYVINVEPRNVLDKLLVQSSKFTQDLIPYREFNCQSGATCTKKLHGIAGQKSAFVSIERRNHTLLDIEMDQDATLSVYYGSQVPFFFDSVYNGSTIQSQLPLTFNAHVTNYIVSSGKSSFTFQFSD